MTTPAGRWHTAQTDTLEHLTGAHQLTGLHLHQLAELVANYPATLDTLQTIIAAHHGHQPHRPPHTGLVICHPRHKARWLARRILTHLAHVPPTIPDPPLPWKPATDEHIVGLWTAPTLGALRRAQGIPVHPNRDRGLNL